VQMDRIYIVGGVMISLLVLSEVDCEFEPRLGTTKVYKIGICCFSAKYALRRKSKDRLARNQNNVSVAVFLLQSGVNVTAKNAKGR
jgi:hypothetical protein